MTAKKQGKFQLQAPDTTPLEVPEAVSSVEDVMDSLVSKDEPENAHKAGQTVALEETAKKNVEKEVDMFMNHLSTAKAGSEEIQTIQEFVRNLGNEEMQRSSVSSALLEKSLNQLSKTSEGATVAGGLIELRNLVSELDPNNTKNLGSKLLRALPFVGKKIDNKMKGFQSSQTQINEIVAGLNAGKASLQEDNKNIAVERQNLWNKMGMIEQYIYSTELLSKKIKDILPAIKEKDAQKARIIEQDILFYVHQRHMDLLGNLAVNMQAYMSLEVVTKNNVELIKGVDRATGTTVQALTVAVMLAQALSNQKVVVETLSSVNDVTEKLVLGVAKELKDTGTQIAKGAMSASISPEVLDQAFSLVIEAMDNIENYKSDAIVSMEKTIDNLKNTTGKMKTYLDKHRENEVAGIKKILEEKRESNGINLNPNKGKLGM